MADDSTSFSYKFGNTDSNPFSCLFFNWKLKKRDDPIIVNEHYLKGECLGRGNYSEVFELLDMNSLHRRAIKVYRMAYIRKDTYNAGCVIPFIANEINVTKQLDHKNVIKIIDSSNESVYASDNVYLIMEYCALSVEELIDSSPKKKLPFYQSRKYFIDLINGIEYLHSIGIVHRDIKPENLLLANDDTLKISDFTVCEVLNRFDKQDSSRHRHGTIAYQPPEVFTSCDFDEYFLSGFKIDIWSCGVTLYKMITNELPFKSHFLGKHVIEDDFKIGYEFENDALLVDFFDKLFIKEPKSRIDIDGIRRHPWFNCQLKVQCAPIPGRNDDYRSITMTPTIHQLHCPLKLAENTVEVPDKNITAFETLKKIPIIQCNRSRRTRRLYDSDHLIERLYKILSSFILFNKFFRNFYTSEAIK